MTLKDKQGSPTIALYREIQQDICAAVSCSGDGDILS